MLRNVRKIWVLVNDTKAYDKELEKKRLLSTSARSRSKQKKESSKSTHDLYSQDLEDLKTPVHERKKKSNYWDYILRD